MTLKNESVVVYPVDTFSGELRVPGDKSISHRVAMFAALASGTSRIKGFLQSSDCISTLQATANLGARIDATATDEITVKGTGGIFSQPDTALDMGNSGTGMRLLTGLLSGFDITARLEGDASLSSRPMGRIKKPLDQMGARIELLGTDGRPPIQVSGGSLNAIEYELPMASAQVKSCILLAGAMADGRTVVREPRPTRDHTERIMRAVGLPLQVSGPEVSIEGTGGARIELEAREWQVPGDFSSAAFWLTAAAVSPGSCVTIQGVGLSPRRTAFMEVLRRMGANIEVLARCDSDCGEPYGDVRVTGSKLHGVVVGGDEIPNLIDECPLVAVAGVFAEGETVICDARELRVKECDRLAVMCKNLRQLGFTVEEREDGMVVEGDMGAIRKGVSVDSCGDHRIAMAMAVLASCADASIRITDVECVKTSYPQFWEHLSNIGGKIEIGR